MIPDSGEYLRIKDLFDRFIASLPPTDEQLKITAAPSLECIETCRQLELETITNTGSLLNFAGRLLSEVERLNKVITDSVERQFEEGEQVIALATPFFPKEHEGQVGTVVGITQEHSPVLYSVKVGERIYPFRASQIEALVPKE